MQPIFLNKRLILCGLVIILSLPVFGQTSNDDAAYEAKLNADAMRSLFNVTQQMQVDGTANIIDIRDQYQRVAEGLPTHVVANYRAGTLFLQNGRPQEAIKYLRRVQILDPNHDAELRLNLARAYQYAGDFDAAIAEYRICLETAKDEWDRTQLQKRIGECQNGRDFYADPKPHVITNLGESVNSRFPEYAPVVSANGSQIIFTSRREEGNASQALVGYDLLPYEDIFQVRLEQNGWGDPEPLLLNSIYNDSNIGWSPDGYTLYLYIDGDIHASRQRANGFWGEPKRVPGLNSSDKETSVSIARSGDRLIFASDRPGGLGGLDLYSAELQRNGKWGKIENLGPTINTPYDEDYPDWDAEAGVLYFSSNGWNTMGGMDVFVSRISEGTKEWQLPVNLGVPINTPKHDFGFRRVPKTNQAYYASEQEDSFGFTDIYHVLLREE